MPDTDDPDDLSARLQFHGQQVQAIDRDGYTEFRALPATWSYADPQPFEELLAEYYSERKGVDLYGQGVDRNFWSGSDAALRLRHIDPTDLALREMTALATRRSVGLNAPRPWIAWDHVSDKAKAWETEAEDVHWTERIPRDAGVQDLWSHYGMADVIDAPVVYSYGMIGENRPHGDHMLALRSGGPGLFHRWSLVETWDRWPRRQEIAGANGGAGGADGMLRLFVSHRWDTPTHPDPEGAQLLALKVGLTLSLARAIGIDALPAGRRTLSGLPEVLAAHLHLLDASLLAGPELRSWAATVEACARAARDEQELWPALRRLESGPVAAPLARVRDSIAVWYDYASMLQSPRSDEEQRLFRDEIVRLNEIQASACTLVLTGGADYLGRAWCFLELCGGMRGTIVELTPTGGHSIEAAGSLTRWGTRSDQLVGALNAVGLEAIRTSGLRVTHDSDLPIVAELLARLPLTGRIETDDSDLVGGTMPLPRVGIGWVLSRAPEPKPLEFTLPALPEAGRVVDPPLLQGAAREFDEVEQLGGTVGLWFYTTQRVLSLSWAARSGELWSVIRPALAARKDLLGRVASEQTLTPATSCCWADSRALADDGLGWTRIVPSRLRLLVVVTQAELVPICRIYQRTLCTHLAAGVPVLTYVPTTGRAQVHLPAEGVATPVGLPAHVLAVPRLRRSEVYFNRQLLSPTATLPAVEELAALRLEPSEGFVRTGDTVRPQLSADEYGPPVEVGHEWLLAHAEQRARVEGLARSLSSSWDTWCAPRLQPEAWQLAVAPVQLGLIEGLVRRVLPVSDNPMRRRKLLDIVVEDEAGYALPPHLLEHASELVRRIREQQATGS